MLFRSGVLLALALIVYALPNTVYGKDCSILNEFITAKHGLKSASKYCSRYLGTSTVTKTRTGEYRTTTTYLPVKTTTKTAIESITETYTGTVAAHSATTTITSKKTTTVTGTAAVRQS